MIGTREKVDALLALAFKLPEIADDNEQDALIMAVSKSITGQRVESVQASDFRPVTIEDRLRRAIDNTLD